MHVLVSLVSLETRVQDLSWDVMSKEGHLDKFNRRRKYMWALLFSEFLGKSEHAKEKNNNVA